MSENKVYYLTEEGVEELRNEYNKLVHVTREEVKSELKEARALGDLSENADYDAARDRQAQIESRIVELENMLQHYEIIDTTNVSKKTVEMGLTVTVCFLDIDEKETYKIVGSFEADPLNGLLSNETPLAAAIMGHKVGDTVEVNAAKPYKVTILEIVSK